MTSFGCNGVSMAGFNPSFRIQGQVYPLISSIVPLQGGSSKFAQIYFMGDEESEIATRSTIVDGLKPDIIRDINQLLHNDNQYVEMFKMDRPLYLDDPRDRPDIVAHVFRLKIQKLLEMLKSEMIFGKPQAWLYSIEWQKRGLPQCLLLLWLSADHRVTPDKIDDVICAEIPDASVDLELHQIVMCNMVRGPCGCINPNSPCMQDGRCSKKYPKQYIAETQLGSDSYPLYRRGSPDDGGQVSNISMRIGGMRVDQEIENRWIVPYNKLLLRSMNYRIRCSSRCYRHSRLCSYV